MAPDQRYEANRQTIGALLSTAGPRIVVPNWQRSYSWGPSDVESFWQDLIDFDAQYPNDNINGKEYFLGSIVLVTGGRTNVLLDGQQRLATATILLSVLRDGRRDYSGDAATRLQSRCIADFDDGTNSTTYFLTMNSFDRDFFREEVQDDIPDQTSSPTVRQQSHARIRKARNYFRDQIEKENQGLESQKLAFERNLRLGTVLLDHMSVVAVSSNDEDNAAAVFETLNDRGVGLSTPDLLRNFLLRQASNDEGRNEIVEFWRVVLDINEDKVNVDEFLRHYWVSHHGDVKFTQVVPRDP